MIMFYGRKGPGPKVRLLAFLLLIVALVFLVLGLTFLAVAFATFLVEFVLKIYGPEGLYLKLAFMALYAASFSYGIFRKKKSE